MMLFVFGVTRCPVWREEIVLEERFVLMFSQSFHLLASSFEQFGLYRVVSFTLRIGRYLYLLLSSFTLE